MINRINFRVVIFPFGFILYRNMCFYKQFLSGICFLSGVLSEQKSMVLVIIL